MKDEAQRQREGITGGLILISIGAIFLLNNLDILRIHDLWKYWPVILIAIGVGKLVDRGVL
jgi:hypothetical protein